FFNATRHRGALLFKYTREYVGADGLLHFDEPFAKVDVITDTFLETPVEKRRQLASSQPTTNRKTMKKMATSSYSGKGE
ncbi:hypothetical protein HK102_011329, partial [Quaeritorhiza haematococci]